MELIDRFWSKVDKSGDCWLWTGGDTGNGLFYGKFWDGNRKVLAHRFSYERFVGELDANLEVDHTCRVPKCVRPEHLVQKTRVENMKNRKDYRLKDDGTKICNRNHIMTMDNTYFGPNGREECRDCNGRNKRGGYNR